MKVATSPNPMPNDLPVPLTEPAIEKALIEARGDLFLASQLLGHVTVTRLDRAIRLSGRLQTAFLAIEEACQDPEYARRTAEQVEQDVARRLALYRSDGLDALHEIATMPLSENSAQNQVKLAAAARLAGGSESGPQDSGIESTLAALNQAYHQAAPRIKSVRERIITFDTPEPLPPAQ